MPSLSALLQRQFRPAPPSPVRPSALLIQPPEWFSQTAEFEKKYDLWLNQQRRDVTEQAALRELSGV